MVILRYLWTMRGLPPAQIGGLRTFRGRFLTVPQNLPSPFFGLVLSKIAIAIRSQRHEAFVALDR